MSNTEKMNDQNWSRAPIEAIAALRCASAVDTLCWVRDRLNAGEDGELVRLIYQREQDLAGRIEAAVRNSIEHQVYRMGRSNYHSHLFSLPVLIECDAEVPHDALDLTAVLPLLMRALRDNGLAGRNGMLLNHIVEHSRLAHLGPSDLYGLGREMFMCSMAASSGQARGQGGRLRALSQASEPQSHERPGGGTMISGHLVGCVYSTRAADTHLESMRCDSLLPRLRAILEFALSGPMPVRVRLGAPQPMCAALASARQMHLQTLVDDMLASERASDDHLSAHIAIDIEAAHVGERFLQFELRRGDLPMVALGASLSMHEGPALDDIIRTLKNQVTEYGLAELEVEYAQNRTLH
ncbi:hypothetical protein [Aromatoleum evansii]|uniref:hypothetical protein n=1 Tax=Aromatoleum evansii TaxID=59406 RepID=UPI00145DEE1A|nr:hypothetical protein [Aromatoleum evansii]NMG28401.1 hypothetical protein [Aromatoleum evansii]